MTIKILALDQALSTGWAFLDGDRVESGVFSIKSDKVCERYDMFESEILRMIRVYYPDLIIFEKAHMRNYNTTKFAMGLITRIEEICSLCDIDYTDVHTGTLKKDMAGHGKASKADMIKKANEIFNKEITSDDEADALLMAEWARRAYLIAEGTL